MARFDTVIKNGKVVTPEGIAMGGVIIHEGKFVGVESDYNLPEANDVIDAEGCWVLPGCVDCESHIISRVTQVDGFWDITDDKKDDLLRESEAAAYGGITTISTWVLIRDDPYIPLIESLKAWGNDKSYVDFGLYPVFCPKTPPVNCPFHGFAHYLVPIQPKHIPVPSRQTVLITRLSLGMRREVAAVEIRAATIAGS